MPTISRRVALAFGMGVVAASATPMGSVIGAQPDSARRFVQDLADQTVKVLGSTSDNSSERVRGLASILQEGLDLEYLAQLAVGRPWRELSSEDRSSFTRVFSTWVVRTQSQRLGQYGGEAFTVKSAQPAGDDDTMVATQLAGGSLAQPVDVLWRVRDSNGRLRIIDVVIGGVSMVVTYRNEFQPIVQRGGVEALTAELQERTRRTQQSS